MIVSCFVVFGLDWNGKMDKNGLLFVFKHIRLMTVFSMASNISKLGLRLDELCRSLLERIGISGAKP